MKLELRKRQNTAKITYLLRNKHQISWLNKICKDQIIITIITRLSLWCLLLIVAIMISQTLPLFIHMQHQQHLIAKWVQWSRISIRTWLRSKRCRRSLRDIKDTWREDTKERLKSKDKSYLVILIQRVN